MAGKDQVNVSKKRKPAHAPKGAEKPNKKKPKHFQAKLVTSKPASTTDGSGKNATGTRKDKKFRSAKTKPKMVESGTMSKRELRLAAKAKALERKKRRKPHFTLEQELASLWEKMRRRDIVKDDRSKLITEAIQKMRGKIPEIATSHVSSRILQTCVNYCSQEEKDVVFEELRPHLLTLSTNAYAVHLVKKMLDNASKKQLEWFVSSLHGHVAPLLRHMVGSVVVEHTFQLGNAAQKRRLLLELYSPELQLFKDLTLSNEGGLLDIITKLGLQKSAVLLHMATVIQPILEKGIIDHSIIHTLLAEYFTIADKSSATEIIQQLSSALLLRMIHTKEGSKVGILCVKHGTAKERKKIVKGMKGHIGKIAFDQYSGLVLICILSVVDDTKLLSKIVISELQTNLRDLVLNKNGRRPLLQLLNPDCNKYLSPSDIAALAFTASSLCAKAEVPLKMTAHENETNDGTAAVDPDDSVDNENIVKLTGVGKKDPCLRRYELLVKSGLAESLIDTCIGNVEELLRSNFGKDVLYEVVHGGSDAILHQSLSDKLAKLHEAIASVAANPKKDESGEEHVFENFHASRTIRKLILSCPAFAATLWNLALKGRCNSWAEGHSLKVVSAFLESPDPEVRGLAKSELRPLIAAGVFESLKDRQAENVS